MIVLSKRIGDKEMLLDLLKKSYVADIVDGDGLIIGSCMVSEFAWKPPKVAYNSMMAQIGYMGHNYRQINFRRIK